MKERMLTGWTLQRIIFVSLGLIMLVQGFMENQWLGMIIGGYFFAMGLFAFGCATRGCFSGNCYTDSNTNNNKVTYVEFEEVKTK